MIRVHEFVSLDGSFEDPGFTVEYGFTDAMGEVLGQLTGASSALLLGRRTWEMFAPAWRDRTAEDDPGAPFFNESAKHVVSSTLTDASAWGGSQVLGPYDPEAIRALGERERGLYVSGSGTLVRALLADGLVDELHLLVYPVVLGTGAKLFPDGTDRLPLALLDQRAFDNGVTHLVYGPAA